MTKEEFRNLINGHPLYLDGATGTNLQDAGMPTGVCPEAWTLEHPDVLKDLQRAYVDAGVNIVYASTFSGNSLKLQEYGLYDRIGQINTDLVKLSKEAVGDKAYVAGDLTMTGVQLYPVGPLKFEELVDIYKEQIRYLADAGCDLLVIETMMSLAESRAALIAANETCDLPVMVTMTFAEDGRSLYGTDPTTAMVVLQSLGADAVGVNCSTGPDQMVDFVTAMRKVTRVPVIAKPNAGLPKLDETGHTVYDMTPETFASETKKLIEAGAQIVGGCCGTTPAHMKALIDLTKDMDTLPVPENHESYLASERKTVHLDIDGPFKIIGERINPTGKKKLQAELREGRLDTVLDMAEAQEEHGAAILDINMGMNGIDEKAMMLEAVAQVGASVNTPLCIDSSHEDVIEAALRQYPGRALINSISLEKDKCEKLLPVAKKYGAMFILLPVSQKGLPKDLEEKKSIINEVLRRSDAEGIGREDIVVDGLVGTVGADQAAGVETVSVIKYCKEELHLLTSCGLSNISFGLPGRVSVNTAFLTMAIQNGLTMAIANPNQELLVNAALATDLLMNKPGADIRYIEHVTELQDKAEELGVTLSAYISGVRSPGGGAAAKKKTSEDSEKTSTGTQDQKQQPPIYTAVLKGNKDRSVDYAREMVSAGEKPEDIINNILIPAINEVGDLFNRKKYFLPQLIASAEAMRCAIDYLQPLIPKKSSGEKMPTLVIATVEGDIHDIGKNLVVMMLKNYGYNVIDLGKDVPARKIVDTAKETHAEFIGLSALMTTTMMRMKDVVELVHEEHVPAKVIIGGAVITQSFCDEIGADGYTPDAADCVRLVQELSAS